MVEGLSELTEGLSELAVCLLEAAVCPLEALSRLLMWSMVVEVVREESMEAAATVTILLETAVCWLQALVSGESESTVVVE